MRRHGDHDIKLETFMCLDLLIEDRQDKTDDMTDRSDSSRVRGRPEDRQLTGDMTEDLDRGGLTKVTQEAWEMFLSMENVFRDVTGASNFGAFNTESEFARRCDSDVSSSFFNIIGSDETASAAVSRQVLEDTFDRNDVSSSCTSRSESITNVNNSWSKLRYSGEKRLCAKD